MRGSPVESSELARRYRGTTAAHYEQQRTGEPSWAREQAIVSSMLEAFPNDGTVIDVPVGTGRFFEFYQARGLHPTGIDVSVDMLTQARQKAEQLGLAVLLEEGDIRRLRFPGEAFDGAVCIRLLNLIDFGDVVPAVQELARVSKRYVILGVRYFVPVSELVRRRGRIGLILRQYVRRLRAAVSARVLRIHSRARMLDTVARSGLVIVRSATVEQFANGSDLVVYLLEKGDVSSTATS
jgi:ubiquinone/menaquinone biosynthesis C-methylase UbiE